MVTFCAILAHLAPLCSPMTKLQSEQGVCRDGLKTIIKTYIYNLLNSVIDEMLGAEERVAFQAAAGIAKFARAQMANFVGCRPATLLASVIAS
jgi:hypothetical protein